MTNIELRQRRRGMGRTQRQLADLLGISIRAVHSFEQGWRKIPVHVERQILFIDMLAHRTGRAPANCWDTRKCPTKVRTQCPAWELQAGQFCWFINGTTCQGSIRRTWQAKMEICRHCKVFLDAVGPVASTDQGIVEPD